MMRLAVKAAIRRAMSSARGDLEQLDQETARELLALYAGAVTDIGIELTGYADDQDNIRAEVLAQLMDMATARMVELAEARNVLLDDRLAQAARLGIRAFGEDAGALDASLLELAEKAVRKVRSFVAEDGLQLSDRLWRNDRQARQLIGEQIEAVVLQGRSASQAAREFLAQGEDIPPEIARKMQAATPGRIKRGLGQALVRDEGSAYANALRVFRTEINRAHGEAFRESMSAHPEVIGERFELSPAHPQKDICDLHASANLHGLGPGVYPVGKSPWPAHPNTLSYLTPVFADEVKPEDRQGKENRMDWLQRQPPGTLRQVLGHKKAAALKAGHLRENQIGTPWRVLKQRYERQGIDIEDL